MSLTRVTDLKVVDRAARKIVRAFREGGVASTEIVGFPSGSIEERVYWRPDLGVWLCRHDKFNGTTLNRIWLAYGMQEPGSVNGLSITVEINFPREGINRKVAGLLAARPGGALVVCHNGRLGGGKKGIGKAAFTSWYGGEPVEVVDGDGRTTMTYAIADLDSDRLAYQLAEYVHACAAFKAGDRPQLPEARHLGFSGSDEEFEGSKKIPASGPTTASCDHGIVRNRLASLLKQARLKVGRDQARDLIVGNPKSPEAEFEIKTAPDPQHIYTAVGQLFVHGVKTPAKARIVVLPSPVPVSTRKTLKSLGLHIVEYRWTKTKIHFKGLDLLFPDTPTSAPINPTH